MKETLLVMGKDAVRALAIAASICGAFYLFASVVMFFPLLFIGVVEGEGLSAAGLASLVIGGVAWVVGATWGGIHWYRGAEHRVFMRKWRAERNERAIERGRQGAHKHCTPDFKKRD